MKHVSKSMLAVYYYNHERPDSYDSESYLDRQRAERRFSGALAKGRIKKSMLAIAYAAYIKGLEEDYQSLFEKAL